MKTCVDASVDEAVEPFKRTTDGQLLVGELELLRLLADAEARRVTPGDGGESTAETEQTNRRS